MLFEWSRRSKKIQEGTSTCVFEDQVCVVPSDNYSNKANDIWMGWKPPERSYFGQLERIRDTEGVTVHDLDGDEIPFVSTACRTSPYVPDPTRRTGV